MLLQARRHRKCAFLDWQVPLQEAALICLDVWDRDTQADKHKRDDRITRARIVPLVAACRPYHSPRLPNLSRAAASNAWPAA